MHPTRSLDEKMDDDEDMFPRRAHWGENIVDPKRDRAKKMQEERNTRVAELAPSAHGGEGKSWVGETGSVESAIGDSGVQVQSSRRPPPNPTNIVRNRRMKQLEQLIREGAYFSRAAMEERAPLLYYEHAGRFEEGDGRYAAGAEFKAGSASWTVSCRAMQEDNIGEQTDTETHARSRVRGRQKADRLGERDHRTGDSEDPEDTMQMQDTDVVRGNNCRRSLRAGGLGEVMSNFLLEASDRSDIKKERDREQEKEREQEEESDEESDHDSRVKLDGGGADAEEEEEDYDDERQRLWDEFCKHMSERFLQGIDFEYFDYSTCDDNKELDDLAQMAQDAEDDYFSSEGAPRAENGTHLSRFEYVPTCPFSQNRLCFRVEAQNRFMRASKGSAADGDYDY